jgi:hypothetical protein
VALIQPDGRFERLHRPINVRIDRLGDPQTRAKIRRLWIFFTFFLEKLDVFEKLGWRDLLRASPGNWAGYYEATL